MKKITKKITAFALAIITVSIFPHIAFAGNAASDIWNGYIASGFSGGSGTESDPFIIKTAEQLAYLASEVNAGKSYEGEYIKLASDIVLNDTANWENWGTTASANSWTPIGVYKNYSTILAVNIIEMPFSGTFDGDGHKVSGIYIKTSSGYQGLFGYVKNGTVKNLGVEKLYISSGSFSDGSFSGGFVGGIVGWSENSTVLNCYNKGIVSGGGDVGGIVGRNYENSTVSNCYNKGIVSGGCDVGGIVGRNVDSTVSDSYNTGNISGEDQIGGVTGLNDISYGTAIVSGCYNTANISGDYCVGGVVGYNRETVSDCYNTGNISGDEEIGGVVGYNSDTVSDCYNTGNISGGEEIGGVTGCNLVRVLDCYNTGVVSVNGDTNVGSVGGVVGYNSDTVSDCYYLAECATDSSGRVQFGIGINSGVSMSNDDVGKTTALTDAQMKQKSSFAGFDFENVWTMAGNSDYPSPELIGIEHYTEGKHSGTEEIPAYDNDSTDRSADKSDNRNKDISDGHENGKKSDSGNIIKIILICVACTAVLGMAAFVAVKIKKKK